MFELSDGLLQTWREEADPKATETDLHRMDALAGEPMPDPYREFVKTHGFVQFGNDPDMTNSFTYSVERPDGVLERRGSIAWLYDPEVMTDVTLRLRNAQPGEAMTILPDSLIAVGANEDGEGQIAIHPASGRVYYIPEVETQSGEDMQIGFVADDFAAFINTLKPHP